MFENIKIVNCTPHAINLIKGGSTTTFEPSGIIPRVSSTEVPVDDIFVKNIMGEVEGLPEEKENTLYIVSAMVFSATNRKDVIAPNTSKAIRNELGHIIGVPNFIVK